MRPEEVSKRGDGAAVEHRSLWSLVDRSYSVFNERDFAAYADLLHPDVELVMSGHVVCGLAAVVEFIAMTTAARPGLRLVNQRAFSEDDETLVTEVQMIDDEIPDPSGDGPVRTWACGLYRQKDGRISEWRVYHDPVAEDLASAALMGVAAEQSALRRVATLVGRQYSPDDLFAAIARELGELLAVDAAAILRYDSDTTATTVAAWSSSDVRIRLGEQLDLAGDNLASEVKRTGRPQRKTDYEDAAGAVAEAVRGHGIRAAVACPIMVEGETWGVIGVLYRGEESPAPDVEGRLAEFCAQAAMAIANANSRRALDQSRARIVKAADDARRGFERDLHDGAQQRLVSLGMEVDALVARLPATEPKELEETLAAFGVGLRDILDHLRELSRGLHPSILSDGGLVPALRALTRRSPIPVELDVDLGPQQLPESVEVAAYYVVSEALANTIKHANAKRVAIHASDRQGTLWLTVSDDGSGGADPTHGSGLTGLADRVEAIGGQMRVDSPAEGGTVIRAQIPLTDQS